MLHPKIFKSLIPNKLWYHLRLHKILKTHEAVAAFWRPIIESYQQGKIKPYYFEPRKDLAGKKIIWQYWGQGVDSNTVPELVQLCFQSVDKYKGEYEVIRLSDETVKEYIDFPDYVYEKVKNGTFNRTFFSDLLRVTLLKTYGGVWLDATILLSDYLPQEYAGMDFFAYQRDDNEPYQEYWKNTYAYYFCWHPRFKVRLLNSILFSQKGEPVIATISDLLMYFWKTQTSIPDYFFFQILHYLLVNENDIANCPIVSDTIPHIVQTKINGGAYNEMSYEEAFRLTSIHKLSYFTDDKMNVLKSILNEYQIL